MEGVGNEVYSVEDVVFVHDSGLGKIVVSEFDSVREEKGLGGIVGNVEAAVVIEGRADVEAITASEGPGRACAGFVVDDDRASNGAKGSDIKVEGDVVVFPVGYSSGEGGSAKEI